MNRLNNYWISLKSIEIRYRLEYSKLPSDCNPQLIIGNRLSCRHPDNWLTASSSQRYMRQKSVLVLFQWRANKKTVLSFVNQQMDFLCVLRRCLDISALLHAGKVISDKSLVTWNCPTTISVVVESGYLMISWVTVEVGENHLSSPGGKKYI